MIGDATADIPLTRDARAIVERAGEIAAKSGASAPTSNDLLRATLELQPQMVPNRDTLAANISPDGAGKGSLPLRRVLVNANREAQSMGHSQVSPAHLLLAMLYSDSPATSLPLQQAGLTLYDVRQRLQGAVESGARTYRRPLPPLRGVVSVSPVFLGIVGIGAAAGALLWTGLAPGLAAPLTLTFVVAGWIASLCIHEFGHAIVAYIGGDRSVATAGYLSLNPLRYTNATMSLVLPVVFLLLGGVALPGGAVYINYSALRGRAWSSAVSLGGPIGTFVCWLTTATAFVAMARANLITSENIDFFGGLGVLGFFMTFALLLNLVPVPGLDGFGIIRPWLSYSLQYTAARYGTLAIFGVYALLWFVTPVRNAFYELIFALTTLAGIPTDLIFVGLVHMRIF